MELNQVDAWLPMRYKIYIVNTYMVHLLLERNKNYDIFNIEASE